MSICAGYFSLLPRIESRRIEEVAKNFSVLNADSADTDVTRIVPTKHGHQICKYNLNAHSYPLVAEDLKGNFLMILGFIHWEDTKHNAEIGPRLLQLIERKAQQFLSSRRVNLSRCLWKGHQGSYT